MKYHRGQKLVGSKGKVWLVTRVIGCIINLRIKGKFAWRYTWELDKLRKKVK